MSWAHSQSLEATSRKSERLTANSYICSVHIYCNKHIHTVMHTLWTHAHVQTHVWEKKKKATERRRTEICSIYMIGFQMKSIRLEGVYACTSDAVFMLWRNWLTLSCKLTVSRGNDEMTLQQFIFHPIQSNKYLITLNSLFSLKSSSLWQWTRLNDYLARFSTCRNRILLSVLFLVLSKC